MALNRRKIVISENKRPFGSNTKECVEKIVRLHADIMAGMNADGPVVFSMYSDSALQSICDRADMFDNAIDYAAFALDYINSFHPFVDGNKRVSLAVALKILEDGGYELEENKDLQTFILMIASGMLDRDRIARWLKDHVQIIHRVS